MLVAPLMYFSFVTGTEIQYQQATPVIYEAAVATSSPEKAAEEASVEGKIAQIKVVKAEYDSDIDSDVLEALIAKFGADHPLIRVAKCESEYRQYNSDGTLLRGKINPQDVGVFQINEGYHLAAARQMGMDIHTLEGNMEYGAYLYETQGLRPWNWSKHCWN